jgi:hypothetical protein
VCARAGAQVLRRLLPGALPAPPRRPRALLRGRHALLAAPLRDARAARARALWRAARWRRSAAPSAARNAWRSWLGQVTPPPAPGRRSAQPFFTQPARTHDSLAGRLHLRGAAARSLQPPRPAASLRSHHHRPHGRRAPPEDELGRSSSLPASFLQLASQLTGCSPARRRRGASTHAAVRLLPQPPPRARGRGRVRVAGGRWLSIRSHTRQARPETLLACAPARREVTTGARPRSAGAATTVAGAAARTSSYTSRRGNGRTSRVATACGLRVAAALTALGVLERFLRCIRVDLTTTHVLGAVEFSPF